MKNEKLVTENVNLVHSVINRLFPAHRGNEDVISEGMMGLVKAANAFDEDASVAFSTYAFCLIRNEIVSYLRQERRFNDMLSLDEPIGEDDEGNAVLLGDTIACEDTIDNIDYASELDDIFCKLKDRDKLIVLFKLKGLSNEEIAEKVHTGVPNVRRILRSIRKKVNITMEGEI